MAQIKPRRSKEEIEQEKQEKLRIREKKAKEKENIKIYNAELYAGWNELYQYVRKEIMGYSLDMMLPKYMVLRLRGMADGKAYANNATEAKAHYDFQTILYTFKSCKMDIIMGFKSNQTKFSNEQHKFNYMMQIIERNINDMVIRLDNAKRAKEKALSINMDHVFHEGAEFKREKKRENRDLKEIW